ncbi:ABC transporter ATP-binding protein [Agromyces soli]|uniref:ABC transporter ATP-binding protein n=1 Tax=Agromyces soli TaxID=659012 RepID=A0ABY4AX62_9MICO|nr:ABC transporter ATP-binding protein [Agromyces soli]UOE27782.1 ABC transporter ATP-binding protein [Agromyces soli]
MTATLEVADLTIVRDADEARIVDGLSFALGPGEVLGVVGESGSGKSTVALGLLAFARPGARIAGGRVVIDGVDLLALRGGELRDARRRLAAYVAQDPATALNPALALRTQLLESLDGPPAENLDRIRRVLRTVGLPADDAFLRRKPRQLSGGQQQRIAIAMAVVARPRVIVLDEPTTGLDVSTQAKVLALVKQLCADEGIAAIYVSHDLAVVADVADRVIVMYGGELVELVPTDALLGAPRHPYSRALLAAVPSARERQVLHPIRGRAPGVGERDAGCVFRARCDFATDACLERPPLEAEPGGRLVRCVRADEVQRLTRITRVADRPERPGLVCRPAVLEAEGIDAHYGERQVLFNVSLELEPGRCLAVVGESGSGKSTLSRCLIGLHEQYEGRLRLDGEELPLTARARPAAARRELQYVFQNPFGSLNPRRTVGSSIAAALRLFGSDGRRTGAVVAEALERVEISARLAERYPAELSGGQRQRVAIARALACEPKVLLCDEVTSALDVSVQASVIELLRGLIDEGLAMLFVTHDLAIVRSIADSVVVLSEGHVVERGETAAVLDRPSHPYTQGLLADTLELPALAG